MFCPNCGSQVSEGERFCPKCGNAMEGTKTENKENAGHSADIAEAIGNPAAMAGKKPAGEETKGKKLGQQARIILASAVGIVVLIAVIGIVVWWMNPERRLNRKIVAARKSGATSLDLSGFDTSGVDSVYHMFVDCSSLEELDLSNFDTRNVKDMEWMFDGCSSLEELDLSSFDTSSVVNMTGMFNDCSSLKEMDLSSFDTSSVESMAAMFKDCSSLGTVYLGEGWTDKWIEYVKDVYPDINFIMK